MPALAALDSPALGEPHLDPAGRGLSLRLAFDVEVGGITGEETAEDLEVRVLEQGQELEYLGIAQLQLLLEIVQLLKFLLPASRCG